MNLVLGKALVLEAPTERHLAPSVFSRGVAPFFECRIENARLHFGVCNRGRAALIEEALDDILLGLVRLCGLSHLGWLSESRVLPGTAPVYGPAQDAWELSPEMCVKVQVALSLGNVDRVCAPQ
jgi:hypothetical protein